MAGFTGIISLGSPLPESATFADKSGYGPEDKFIHQYKITPEYRIEQFTNSKFEAEKILEQDDDLLILTEGVILNLHFLASTTNKKKTFEIISTLYKNSGKDFVKDLRGDFSGIIYDRKLDEWFIYTNHTGSKRIFYYKDEKYFIFSSDVKEIAHLLGKLGISKSIDEAAAYLILTNGFMLEDHTLLQEVKRLAPGSYISLKDKQIHIHNYFNLKNIEPSNLNKAQIIEKMDVLFMNALRLEFEKDKEYGYKHIVTLSGGLDSRMTVLLAHKLGYTEQLNFTFSQANYLDEQIAKKIATDHRHNFLFQALDGGNYLKHIEDAVYLNDGLILYSGAAHVLDSVKNMNFDQYGLIHTGLIGDAVIGSFLSKPERIKPSVTDGMYSRKMYKKIEAKLDSIIKDYESEELYKFYSRGFLGAMNGNYTFDLVSQAVSPFLDTDFLSFCYSIPESMKYKQQIYLEWIAAKHPEIDAYPWEKTGVSPLKSNNYRKYFNIGYYQRMSLKFFDKISGKTKSGMNPFDYWFSQNPSLGDTINRYFEAHIDLLPQELQKDSRKLYKEGNTNEKLQVISLLAGVKLVI